jgi:hypothetical protein
MKQDILRTMIRKQIKSSLNEVGNFKEAVPDARGQVSSTLGKAEKMTSVKMLKKALGQGGPQQKASGLLAVVKAISDSDPQVMRTLARLLMKSDDTNTTSEPSVTTEAIPASLSSRSARVDKTQSMKMLKSALGTKPATQQADFVLDLLKGLNLKKGAKQRLFQKMRRELGAKETE